MKTPLNIFSALPTAALDFSSDVFNGIAGVIPSIHLVQCFRDRSVCRGTPLNKWACMKFAIPSSLRTDGAFLIIGGTLI